MSDIEFEKELKVTDTTIEGLEVVDLSVHGDARGWFKENLQRAKMTALGIPDMRVVQNNVSFNAERGVMPVSTPSPGTSSSPWRRAPSSARGWCV